MATPAVSLIVTTYQMPAHLERVLAAVQQQTIADRLEVIVSDDGSTDETPEVVRRFAADANFPVKFVTQPHEGFQLSRTRNEGVRQATAPHLVFLDGDCLVEPDHVEQHLQAWRPQRVTNTYCVRLEQAASERITVDSARSGGYLRDVPNRELRKLWMMQLKAWWYRGIRHARRPTLRGGNMGISRADYERVNGYDERFRAWGKEDDDLGMRLRAVGIKVDYILHRTRTYHLWHPPASSKPQKYKEGENYAYLFRKIRLTRCLAGLQRRTPADLRIRLVGRAAENAEAIRWVQGAGCQIVHYGQQPVDMELALASDVRFGRECDCRLVFVDGDSAALPAGSKAADIVLSTDGSLGGDHQVRLPFHEWASFLAAIGFADPVGELAGRASLARRRPAA